jgi:hypothetical protein
MANIRLNPETMSNPASQKRLKTFQPGSREPAYTQTPGLRPESAQTCVLQPSAGSAGNLPCSFLGRHVAFEIPIPDVGKFDLLMMGSHGHSALGNLVMDSVATQVFAHCKTPVLLVR